MDFRTFDVAAYNARLAELTEAADRNRGGARQPPPGAAKAARIAAMGKLPVLLESDVLPAVLECLRLHPRIARGPDGAALVWRQNTGAHEVDGRHVRYAFAGCSDILGMLKGGQFLAVEVKRPGGMPTPAQVQFLANVRANGGLAVVARGVDDVMRALA